MSTNNLEYEGYFRGLVRGLKTDLDFESRSLIFQFKVVTQVDNEVHTSWVDHVTLPLQGREKQVAKSGESFQEMIGNIAVCGNRLIEGKYIPETILILPAEEMEEIDRMILAAADW